MHASKEILLARELYVAENSAGHCDFSPSLWLPSVRAQTLSIVSAGVRPLIHFIDDVPCPLALFGAEAVFPIHVACEPQGPRQLPFCVLGRKLVEMQRWQDI